MVVLAQDSCLCTIYWNASKVIFSNKYHMYGTRRCEQHVLKFIFDQMASKLPVVNTPIQIRRSHLCDLGRHQYLVMVPFDDVIKKHCTIFRCRKS